MEMRVEFTTADVRGALLHMPVPCCPFELWDHIDNNIYTQIRQRIVATQDAHRHLSLPHPRPPAAQEHTHASGAEAIATKLPSLPAVPVLEPRPQPGHLEPEQQQLQQPEPNQQPQSLRRRLNQSLEAARYWK